MKQLLRKLVQAETTAERGERAGAEVISDELGRSKINSRIDSWDGNRANIIAQIKSAGRRGALLFACHLDIVGPGDACCLDLRQETQRHAMTSPTPAGAGPPDVWREEDLGF